MSRDRTADVSINVEGMHSGCRPVLLRDRNVSNVRVRGRDSRRSYKKAERLLLPLRVAGILSRRRAPWRHYRQRTG